MLLDADHSRSTIRVGGGSTFCGTKGKTFGFRNKDLENVLHRWGESEQLGLSYTKLNQRYQEMHHVWRHDSHISLLCTERVIFDKPSGYAF